MQVPFPLDHLAPCWAWTTGGAIEMGRGGGRRDKLLPKFTVPVSPQQCLCTFILVVAAEFTLQFCQLLENQLQVPLGTLASAGALSQSSLWSCTRSSSELRHSNPADWGLLRGLPVGVPAQRSSHSNLFPLFPQPRGRYLLPAIAPSTIPFPVTWLITFYQVNDSLHSSLSVRIPMVFCVS